MRNLTSLLVVSALVLMLAPANAIFAQNQLGDGRALDRNLQRGSGGRNSSGARNDRINFQINNDRVTGNTTGSDFFRDNVDYRSSGEFGDSTGDDALFRFRANSASSSIGALRARSQGFNFGTQSVYRSAAPTTGGQVNFASQRSRLLQFGGFRTAGADLGALSGLSFSLLREQTSFQRDQQLNAGNRLLRDLGQTRSGFGDRANLFDATGSFRPRPVDRDAQGMRLDMLRTPGPDGVRRIGDDEDGQWNRMLPGGRDTAELLGYNPDQVTNTGAIGIEMQALLLGRGQRDEGALDRRVKRIERSILNPLERSEATRGQDIYIDILNEAKQRAEGNAETDDYDPYRQRTVDLESPTRERLKEAEEARLKTMRELGLLPKAGEDDPTVDDDDADALEKLLKTIEANKAPLPSLAGNQTDPATLALKEAEAAMMSGKYFDAERKYQHALRLRTGYPLARIGLVHAQLGAGLARSASGNLRSVFNDHPELIGVRYEPELLPKEERLKWAQKELERMVDQTARQEPALLLAYLGYQTGNRDVTQFGLDLAATRAPNDALLPVLRRIWLNEKDASDDAQPQDDKQGQGNADQPAKDASKVEPTPAEDPSK